MTDSKPICSIEGCGKPSKQKGWCWGHYSKWRKYGDPHTQRRATPDIYGPVTCVADGCDKAVLARGLCSKHYHRMHRHGDHTITNRAATGELLAWIKANADHSADECLKWPFRSTNQQGYGVASYEGSTHNASNVMCRIAHGEPPTPLHEAAHSCGKGHEGCVSPRHLRWATRSENHADKHIHGTMPVGEKSSSAKLTAEQVISIRDGNESATIVAEKYSIGYAYVFQIRARGCWKHLK